MPTPSFRLRMQALLTRVGSRLTPTHIQKLNAVVNYLEVGRWLAEQGFEVPARYDTRAELHRRLGLPLANIRTLYLEFGVYQGASMRWWCDILRHTDSSLYGFDSFQGLPEDWDSRRRKGTFSVRGKIPYFDDPRVMLHPGWFSDTLPQVRFPPHDRIVIHLDADLYSSTEFVLRTLRPLIVPGAIVIFDEFCDRFHELRAFDEYLRAHGDRFRCVGATINLEQVAFERIS